MIKPSTLFKILFVCVLFISCDDEPLEGDFVTNEDVMDDDDDSDGDGDDDTTDDPDNQALLLSEFTQQAEGSSELLTVNYTYNSENRLLREDFSNGGYLIYNYQDNQLVSTISSFDGDTEDIETYTYDSQGRVASITFEINGSTNTNILSYNSDNSVIEEYNAVTNELESRNTLSNGNVLRIESFSGNESNELLEFFELTYDEMNGPLRNIDLRDRIFTIVSENLINIPGYNLNNILSEQYTSLQDNIAETYTYSHTYNDEGYPIISTLVIDDGEDTETINYTLTYIPAN